MHYASVKSTEIRLDIMKGCFDTSLEKYRLPAVKPIARKSTKEISVAPTVTPVFLSDLVERFNEWENHIKNVDVDNSWITCMLGNYWKNGQVYRSAKSQKG